MSVPRNPAVARNALLAVQEQFADVVAAIAGLVAQLEAQGFAEQAREIITILFIQQRKATP
jgi:hypothetical protein